MGTVGGRFAIGQATLDFIRVDLGRVGFVVGLGFGDGDALGPPFAALGWFDFGEDTRHIEEGFARSR